VFSGQVHTPLLPPPLQTTNRAHPGNDDVISIRAQDDGDTMGLVFESEKGDKISGAYRSGGLVVSCGPTLPGFAQPTDDIFTPFSQHAPPPPSLHPQPPHPHHTDFDLKLMDIDSEHLGIPETEYSVTVSAAVMRGEWGPDDVGSGGSWALSLAAGDAVLLLVVLL